MSPSLPLIFLLPLSLLFSSCQLEIEEISFLLISTDQLQAEQYNNEISKFLEGRNHLLKTISDITYLEEDSIKQFRALILSGLDLHELDHLQINALERYLKAGGTCFGIGLKASEQSRFKSDKLFASFRDSSNRHLGAPQMVTTHSFGRGQFFSMWNKSNDSLSLELITQTLTTGVDELQKLDYTRLESSLAPPDHWFEIDTLTMSLDEPMELEILKNGDVFFIERGGQIKIYDCKIQKVNILAKLETISSESNGLNGFALDLNFASNGLIYLSYLPKADSNHQLISRFPFRENTLDITSEDVIMKIPLDKTNGWHGTNALEIDSKGNLYISIGDFTVQTNDVAGYAQIDERPGRAHHDAQRTSANTNSYKGKILRIRPESDGNYTIPDRNLFPNESDKTKAEIFVMGCRNPYRFILDPHTDVLYFGDVGPDAWEDGEKGPRGYDELNIAETGGFYGWPYFVADNQAYHDFNYGTNQLGSLFDPQNPYNDSPNNTGLRKLPSAQKPLLWYHKGESDEFPYMGTGGMNIMVGPKYYVKDYPESSVRFPAYYDERLFLYDWVRNWIVTIELDENNSGIKRIEPFLSTQSFSKIIDMKFGPDGSLYLLEYGTKGYQANEDASIKRIKFSAERPKTMITNQVMTGAASWEKMLPIKEGLTEGRQILLNHTCLTCHSPTEKVIGPSFEQIAERFFEDVFAHEYLPKKIIEGGTGNWPGNIIMPANLNLTTQQAKEITKYILSFKEMTY